MPGRLLSPLFFIVMSIPLNAEVVYGESVFPLSSVVSQVKREIAAAQATTGSGLGLVLDKVEVTLAVARVADANGKVEFGVPLLKAEADVGGERRVESASSVKVELAPPAPLAILSKEEMEGFGLAEAIVTTRAELLKGLKEVPTLPPKKVVITARFGVKTTVKAGAKLNLVIFSIGGGGSESYSGSNTVVLTFSKSKAP